MKVVDFGFSKVHLKASKSNTITCPRIGTTSPAAFTYGRANWFKADVYSFSVMCSVILYGIEAYNEAIFVQQFVVEKGQNFRQTFLKELALLITEGWATNRDSRSEFVDICIRLEELKHWLLRHHTLGSSLQHKKKGYSNLYIEEMPKACQHQRSHVCLQVLLDSSVEDKWFEVSLRHFNRLWKIRLCKL